MLTIRRATHDDVPAITAIYNDAVENTTATFDTVLKTEGQMRDWLAAHDDRHPVIVALDAGELVGWAALSRWSDRNAYDETAESSFYVHSSHRGRGIGKQLKMAILDEGRRAGLHTILARIAEGNEASMHINRLCGFETIGVMREVGHKFGRRLDVHLMQIILPESS